ncbi:DUF885 domain-containing protein [Sediminibacterium ginsengisoli]|uniref:Uncharacterized conserved protein, DUF885 familyt n=1 Tax=Sediminibacterium ginsengisoli TaxID=413434 RepID=A0A1T4M5K0_9BACT|nr:DUF885 domain-containing protein [Sediminibacterium ginsengisoli]SJZ62058.1 Uncharacterized conserved protein, DUF885 familyt [Sediminibacterium ginsengisoli]
MNSMMKKLGTAAVVLLTAACNLSNTNPTGAANSELAALFDTYYEDRLQLFPVEATLNGDERYNNLLYIDFTDSYRKKLKEFYSTNLTYLTRFNRDYLNANDQLSYDIFKREMQINIEGLSYHDNYMPLNQFQSMHLLFAQLGSGTVIQPFKTVKDYNDWLQRASVFPAYADSAIVYFRKGMKEGTVLPKKLVEKMIPQMRAMDTTVTASVFYGPVTNLPASFSAADKASLTTAYTKLIQEQLAPAYRRLADFLQTEYLPAARTTTGISEIPDGKKFYRFLIRQQTTTDKTSEEIYNTGLSEVQRIKEEMERVKTETGFTGDLAAFFNYMKTDHRFTPYKTAGEILAAFDSIHQTMNPYLKKLFGLKPKTPFEIRQTEAFRAASASAEYNQGGADGTRPGIFYIPILDPTQFNTTSGMQSLFLHEAIPGHHYQISLQQENKQLPRFRRFGGNNAYAEGWALYCESLGSELGLYKDPYQYMGALGDEMHRAIRLVVDVAMHTKGMTREEAIAYMMANEQISEEGATAEIERYMSIPAQALGYKIGALKIRELRSRYEKMGGEKFKLSAFHDAILKDGNMPLNILEKKMDKWAAKWDN